MSTDVFTAADILPHQPPIVITKPWFAQGWVIGAVLASVVSCFAAFAYLANAWAAELLLPFACLLWLITLVKYFKGVRFVEVYADLVRVYTLDAIAPASEIPFDKMTLVQDLNEIYFIRKARFTGGYSLKKVYWQRDWEQLQLVFSTNASYVMQNYKQKSHGGFDNIPMPFINRRNRGFGILGLLMVIYELFVAALLWPFFKGAK